MVLVCLRENAYICTEIDTQVVMFIRQVKKFNRDKTKTYYQYTLAQAQRIGGKVVQKNILYLGSDPLLQNKDNREKVLERLTSLIYGQKYLFSEQLPAQLEELAQRLYRKFQMKYPEGIQNEIALPPRKDDADYQTIDVNGIKYKDVKDFGRENLTTQIIKRLALEDFLIRLGFTKNKAVLAQIAVIARALYAESEHKTAQILQDNSALPYIWKIKDRITYKQLYAIADKLYEHKNEIESFLYQRTKDLFHLDDTVMIYDLSNTYFETRKPESQLARFGKGKEKRHDAPLVVFGAVINQAGFIKHSRIFPGNTPDMKTLKDIIAELEGGKQGDLKEKIFVLDAGIATESNLDFLRQEGYKYVVVSRTRPKDYTLNHEKGFTEVSTARNQYKVKLQLIENKEHTGDSWIYVQSPQKAKKERSIDEKLTKRFEEELKHLREGFKKRNGTKKPEKVWMRIGRIKEKYKSISSLYEIELEIEDNKAVDLTWQRKDRSGKQEKREGVYFLRTNYTVKDEETVWKIYNTIREVESTFRSLKSDLNIRPVYHQKDERIESHIFLTVLAYQLVNTIRFMLKDAGIHYSWREILRIMHTQKLVTGQFPSEKRTIKITKNSEPEEKVKEIYKATNTKAHIKPLKSVVYH